MNGCGCVTVRKLDCDAGLRLFRLITPIREMQSRIRRALFRFELETCRCFARREYRRGAWTVNPARSSRVSSCKSFDVVTFLTRGAGCCDGIPPTTF